MKPALLLCALAVLPPCIAQQPDFLQTGAPIAAAPVDPAIQHALANIDTDHLRKTVETLAGFKNRNSISTMDQNLPIGTGADVAAEWIFRQLQQIAAGCDRCLEVRKDTFLADPASPEGHAWAARVPRPTRMTNVYAILRGTEPAQARLSYMVMGHYDSRNGNVLDTQGTAPGANDDASGVAVVLECARVLSKLRLPSTLVFAAVAGEEQGLVGSAHLARLARDEGWQLEAVLSNDIVGGNTTPGDSLQLKDRVRVFSEGLPVAATPEQIRHLRAIGAENDSPSRQLARALEDVAQTYFPARSAAPFDAWMVTRPDRYLRGGDHTSFNHEGFAAVRLTEWREDYNHQHQDKGDLVDFVDFDYLAKVARLNAAALATLALSPGRPAKTEIDAQKLENGTTLRWQPAPGKADHYELLWRDTTAFDWQYAQSLPATPNPAPITITVPISKDNVYFGIRAVDSSGHRSLAVTPLF